MFWVGYLSCWFFLRYYFFCECQPINIQLFNWSSDNDDAGHFQHLFHVCGALPYSKRLWLSFFSLMVPLLCSDIFLIRLLWVRLVLFSVVFIYTVTLYNSILFVYSFLRGTFFYNDFPFILCSIWSLPTPYNRLCLYSLPYFFKRVFLYLF